MIDCSAYLDAKLAHTSQAMMLCSAALLNAAMIRMPLLAEHKLGWLARPPRGPRKFCIFLSRERQRCRRFLQSTSRVPQLQKVRTPNYLAAPAKSRRTLRLPCTRGYRSFETVYPSRRELSSKRCDRSHSKRAGGCETRKCSNQSVAYVYESS